MEKIIIYGAGGLGREVLQIVRAALCPGAQVLGFVDDGVEAGAVRNDAVVLGGGDYLDSLAEPIGLVLGIMSPAVKKELYTRHSRNPLISFPTVIHPRAQVSEYARLQEGMVVAASCAISVDVTIGRCVFFNGGAGVGHDTVVGDFTSVMHAAIAGNVTVGECCLIGMQSAIRQGLSIGRNSTVGMGSIVLRDVPENVMVLGNPAMMIE